MDIVDYLLSISSKKIKYGLKRTEELLKVCNSPHKKVYSIQVVGTNGKGSVAAFLSSIISSAGYKVGLFSSPHLVSLNERIRINNELIKDEDLKKFIKKYKKAIRLIEPSFFELLTVIAVWYFHQKNVNYCILETGLGGRFDSVTACENQGVVFTPISMDHHSLLGHTLSLIATDKSKAINRNTQFSFSSKQSASVMEILDRQAKQNNLKLMLVNQAVPEKLSSHLYGAHQSDNAKLSKTVVNYLIKKNIINASDQAIERGLKNTVWHGRFQIVQINPTVIFDVAHNKASIECFMKSVNTYIKNKAIQKKYLVCAFERNKKIKSTLKKYEKIFNQIICSETNIRDSMPAHDIASVFRGSKNIIIQKNINKAIAFGLENTHKQDVVIILGSHFLGPAVNSFFKNCFALDHKRLLS